MREGVHARLQAFDAWRQVTEIILSGCPEEAVGANRQNVIIDLLTDLLKKVSVHDLWCVEVSGNGPPTTKSSAVLSLLHNTVIKRFFVCSACRMVLWMTCSVQPAELYSL